MAGDRRLPHALQQLEQSTGVEPGHGPPFWALVARYPLAERARGYLIAKGMDERED